MDDAKKAYRQTEQDAKQTWRKLDGDEDLKDLGNAGDDLTRTVDREREEQPTR
jgi:hypothetical protein